MQNAAIATPAKRPDWPLWWFAQLESAQEAGDAERAALAVRELRRLGVEVRWKWVPPSRTEVTHAG